MKKILSFLSLILIFTLSACGNNTTITDTETETKTETGTTTMEYQKIFSGLEYSEDALVYETFKIKLNEIEEGTLKEKLNPYKSEDLMVDAIFTSPNGATYTKAGYYYQPYTVKLDTFTTPSDYYYLDNEIKGTDIATKGASPYMVVSFRPKEVGTYNFTIKVTVFGIERESFTGSIEVKDTETSSTYKGKIEVDSTNNAYFKYEYDGTYLPIGINNCWYTSSQRKSYDYDEWFKRMNNVGMNYSRIWLASWGFALHIGSGAKIDDFDGRQNQLARLDRVLEVAEDNDIYITLVLLNHGQFSKYVNAEWNQNTYSEILDYPFQFFTNSTAKALYKDELRYIIARYGDTDSIMSYELFNEVDWSDNFYSLDFKKWANEMSTYIKENDPYDRLITNSFADISKESGVFSSLETIDFASIHTYQYQASSGIINKVKNELSKYYSSYNKPVMFEEWGVNSNSGSDTYSDDPDGTMLYQALMGSVFSYGSGSVMNWWWDTYIHRYNLYELYRGLGTLAKIIDLEGEVTHETKANATVSNTSLDMLGLSTTLHKYLYIYDTNYTKTSESKTDFSDTSFSYSLDNGNYEVILLNPLTGEYINNTSVEVTNNLMNLNLSFTNDLIIIINKK